MQQNDLLLLTGNDILTLFKGRELDVLQRIKRAYQIHDRGDSHVPHSNFLRFPNRDKERIIALPAYLGGEFEVAGLKWISSFPDNLASGLERASAVLLLNSIQTGHLKAILESSVISAKRTGASAALAGHTLFGQTPLKQIGVIGCGLINFETVRFLLIQRPELETLFITDLSLARAEEFKRKCGELSAQLKVEIVKESNSVFQNASVVALATTAIKPHIDDLSACQAGCVLLHTSLRDLSAEVILAADNVVDDIDHVCRAQTSVHLAEQQIGNRDFIRCTIGNLLNETAPPRPANKISIFSPFGLGILDLVLGQFVYELALEQQQGVTLDSFLPLPWSQRVEHN